MRRISDEIHNNVVSLLNNGISTHRVTERCNVSQSTVSRIRRKCFPNQSKPKSGRKALLTPMQKRLIVRKLTSGQIETNTVAQKYLSDNQKVIVSAQTIRNSLKQAGLKASVKVKKPLLIKRHIQQRLVFCRKYKNWTIDDWKRVIWSDESKINRIGSDGLKWCWKTSNLQLQTQLQPQHVQTTVKYGGGSLMIWGCMSNYGVGNLVRIDGGLDTELYCKILEEDLASSVEFYGGDLNDFIFQQDNDPKHKSKMVTKWLSESKIEVLDWPAQSPDINPIENLWVHLKIRLSAYDSVPTSMHELWERVEKVWNDIPAEFCVKLIESMPKRVNAVLKAKVWHSKY